MKVGIVIIHWPSCVVVWTSYYIINRLGCRNESLRLDVQNLRAVTDHRPLSYDVGGSEGVWERHW